MGKEQKRRQRQKGRRSEHTYLGIPHYIIRSPEFGRLSAWGMKLLIELAGNHNGKNNGDLSAAFSVLKDRGWNSSGTLQAALGELLRAGWIVRTRHGGRNRCALYAVTWWPVDECAGKWLEIRPETAASHKWKTDSALAMRCNALAMRCNERGDEAA
jgi:hypothetical protein